MRPTLNMNWYLMFKSIAISILKRYEKRILEHIYYITILVVLIPAISFFELFIVLPTVVETGSIAFYFHLFVGLFVTINVLGNLVYGVYTDTSIKRHIIKLKENWNECSVCETRVPPRAWHCEICNICILKRDHHCKFFATCVGYYNFRYFLLFTFYMFIGMVYAMYFNICFVKLSISWDNGLMIAKILFPIANFMIHFNLESLYLLLVVGTIIIASGSGFILYYHFKNVLKGCTLHESKCNLKIYDKGWRQNIIEVLGNKWYLALILPFFHSPLVGNGVEWNLGDKYD